MEDLMKQFFTWLLALVLAAFQPLGIAILVLMVVWTLNIIMGIAADNNNKEDFKLKKALTAAKQLEFIYLCRAIWFSRLSF